jgi:hypothetical protein
MQRNLKFQSALMGIIVMVAGAACDMPFRQGSPVPVLMPTTTPAAVTQLPTEAPTEPAASAEGKTVTAGQAFAVFTRYTIAVPAGWTDMNQVVEGVVDTLLITKGEYTLMISQAEAGGGQCHFEGEPGEGQVFPTAGVSISGTASEFMRGSGDDGLNWTVCEMGPDTFGFPTTFGYITYQTPSPADEATLAEMDGMVASLAVVAP